MKRIHSRLVWIALIGLATMAGSCSESPKKSPDVVVGIRKSLDDSGFKDVSVKQDRDKGLVTLDGHVATEEDKSRAESIYCAPMER